MKNRQLHSAGKSTIVIIIFIVLVCMAHFNLKENSRNEKVDRYFLLQLNNVKEKISRLKALSQKKAPLSMLRQNFFQSRLAYKKFAVLSDYFNQYETKLLNGPAIDRIESEVADRIIPPQGFQAVEQLLFGNWKPGSWHECAALLEDMLKSISKMETEPDRIYKFKDELLWDAIRSSVVQLTAMGITGFDSPVANYSLREAGATINGVKNILAFFKPDIEKKEPGAFNQLIALSDKANSYLLTNNRFNEFNRLVFITQYLNPFYKQLVQTRIKTGIGIPEGRNAINFNTESIFRDDLLSINFFSPPQEYWVTPERVQLGKMLFADPVLSGTNTRSCASCHQPEKAFTDGLVKPYALDDITPLARNTPTLWNSGYQTKQFFDGRADILENQLDEVVHNAAEMKGSLKKSVDELKKSPRYYPLFKEAYSGEKEPVSAFNIANAISCYVRSLSSLNSRFDQYMRGHKSKLSEAEKNGFNLFTGKAKCATCHFVPLFNGLVPPFFSDTESEVLGVPKSKNKKAAAADPDLGKYLFTHSEIHKYAFKTPTLRNIELTAPYMHNGVFNTLEEVMEFYNNGGGAGLKIELPNQTLPPDKLNLSKKEIADVISFMKTLTDTVYKKEVFLSKQ
jgi:cytochrome c peroxidase